MSARFLLAAGLLAGFLPAQAVRVIPPTAMTTDANADSWLPFVYEGGARTQHLIDGGAVTTSGTALIREFAYRRDAVNTNAFTGRKIANYTVTIGYSLNSPSTMSATFASNRSGTPITVFQGTYDLPAQPPATGIGAWNVVFKLTTPWVYQRANGHLLIELEEAGSANNKNEYALDAHKASMSTGYANTFGDKGPLLNSDAYQVTCPDAAQLKPGGAATIQVTGLSKNYPAAAIYGFSRTAYGPVALPFDLTALGAPKNFVHVSLDLVLPLPVQQVGSSWQGSVSLPIPNLPALSGFVLYGQALFADAASNAFGSVWSNGVGMILAGHAPTSMLYQSDSTSAQGSMVFAGGESGGPVIQLTGALN